MNLRKEDKVSLRDAFIPNSLDKKLRVDFYLGSVQGSYSLQDSFKVDYLSAYLLFYDNL